MPYQFKTSYPAYKEALATLSETQRQVYDAIICMGKCNDRMIVEFLSWPINRVTPRRNELLAMGKIQEVGKFKDTLTGRLTFYWNVSEKQLKMF